MFSSFNINYSLVRQTACGLFIFLCGLSSACNPPKEEGNDQDQGDMDMEIQMVDMMESDLDLGAVEDPCEDIENCELAECADAPICAPCEEGGDCSYSGVLKVYGRATSVQGQTISGLKIRALCGETESIIEPGENGDYLLNLNVANCERLLVIAERESGTEGYVPIIKRFNMPPPVNTINVNFKLIPGTEIRCDGVNCEATGVFSRTDRGVFYTGYAYNSSELNDVNNFGAIFESTNGELLWLHRFIYADYRDEQSQTIQRLPYQNYPTWTYGLSPLTYETRAWVADLFEGYTAPDYHSEENASVNWEQYGPYLVDPEIDPDQDGEYETIDMITYKLDFGRGQWSELAQDGTPLRSHIFAQIESGYKDFRHSVPADTLIGSGEYLVKVPAYYLRGVQTTGTYGPAVKNGPDDMGRLNTRGLYRRDFSAIPHFGSGVFALGQPIPKSCWLIQVADDCGAPVFGAELIISGVNHGYHYNEITDRQGQACVEVGRSESGGADFDGDGLGNERFDIEISAQPPLSQRRLIPSRDRIESTPSVEADCRNPSACEMLTFSFQNCQN